MTDDETTTEQLVEIEGQAADTPTTEYTPPDGWRVLAVGERLRDGDVTVCRDGSQYPADRLGGWVGSNQRYIRLIEREPQPEAEPVQVREGRWQTRNGEIKNIRPCEPLKGAHFVWPWTDGIKTFQDNGRHLAAESPNDLVEYLGPIEQEPEPQPESDADLRIRLLQQANDSQAETIGRLLSEARDLNMEIGGLERQLSERDARIRDVETMHAAAAQAVVDAGKGNDKLRAQVDELRSEVSYVQRLLGESNRKVAQLEDLVASLRTINEAQEKAFEAACQHNSDLQSRLNGVCSEWVQQAETIRKLRIELDAAQQVPADSPELRQLRADLAEVGHDRDMYRHEHELLVQDIDATHQRTKAETVEAIAEWLEPIRREDPHLRAVILFHLPKIIRSLAGLNTPEDVD